MARITVEDCLEKVDNQYDLVLLAKERTVQLNAGVPMLVEEDNDKRTIISLREIGDGKIEINDFNFLLNYDWPGNVRELENEIQRGLLQSGDADFIAVEHLSPRLHKSAGLLGRVRPPEGSLKDMMAAVEQRLLVEALTAHEGNKTATAKSLNITREGLHKKLKRYGITS